MINMYNFNNLIINLMKSFIKLPTPVNISIFWNFGSMLGICLLIQIISGLFLSMHYCPNVDMAFNSVIHIIQDVKMGWIMRNIHMNGASFYFIFMYLHLIRGIYYHSYKLIYTWILGVLIMLLSMATAFLGYVLPWGQMSFWGATVITNLLSAIPYVGPMIVNWLWGGFSINNATLNRFYSFHFILPLLILVLVIFHLMFLHETGSNNPLGLNSNFYKIPFYMYFMIKDLVGFFIFFFIFFIMIFQYPYILSDPDNFIPANPMITPVHIQPEWYFLFAYAILRSIPNKLGGVIALFLSILILLILPMNSNYLIKTSKFYPFNQFLFWMFISSCFMLTWLGAQVIEYPFYELSQINSLIYFSYFLLMPILNNFWDLILFNDK